MIFILLPCYCDILQLEKVAIAGFELGPCHMIEICIACSTTKPNRGVTARIVPYSKLSSSELIPQMSFSRASKTV